MEAWIIVLMVGLLSVSPVNALDPNYINNIFKGGETEQQVIQILGKPTRIILSSCGALGPEYICKNLYYDDFQGMKYKIILQSYKCSLEYYCEKPETSVCELNHFCHAEKRGSGDNWLVMGWTTL
jgi:hypothetical protein